MLNSSTPTPVGRYPNSRAREGPVLGTLPDLAFGTLSSIMETLISSWRTQNSGNSWRLDSKRGHSSGCGVTSRMDLQGLLDCLEQDLGEACADCVSAAPSGAEGTMVQMKKMQIKSPEPLPVRPARFSLETCVTSRRSEREPSERL